MITRYLQKFKDEKVHKSLVILSAKKNYTIMEEDFEFIEDIRLYDEVK